MSTFKSELFQICREVAEEWVDWSFVSGTFKNKSLKHTELQIHPAFAFRSGNTPLQPAVWMENKKSMALFKKILGRTRATSIVKFQVIAQDLHYMPEQLRRGCTILEDKQSLSAHLSPAHYDSVTKTLVEVSEAKPVLRAMMEDGIATIKRLYDLSSEDNFLHNLPPKYETFKTLPYDEMDRQKGIMLCIVHILLGDFDFVEKYRSDEFKTQFPKQIDDLDKIIAALPELKRRYEETGKVI